MLLAIHAISERINIFENKDLYNKFFIFIFKMIKMSQKYSQDEAQALVKALKEGNQLAFSIVYKTYAAQTFSLAFKYLLNKELAEDAVQNLFLKLWLKKEEIDETKPINRYLFTMLKNDLLNTLRDSKKNIYLLEDCLSMVLELEDNSQNENLKQEQMNIIQQALEQLSPQRRKVFEMKVSGKYSNQEIADKLNLSINTIKFQYSQSLKQIRATVGELSLLLLYCMM